MYLLWDSGYIINHNTNQHLELVGFKFYDGAILELEYK